MKPISFFSTFILFTLFISGFSLKAHETSEAPDVFFIKNKGQWNDKVLFKTDVPGASVFFEKNGFTYSFFDPQFLYDLHEREHTGENVNNVIVPTHAVKMEFLNSFPSQVSGSHKMAAYHNYFIGNDKTQWATDVPLYEEINYSEIYEGIALRVYSSKNSLKYDYVLAPNADAKKIQIKYEGVDGICVKNGELYLSTSVGETIEGKPYAYQIIDGEKIEVPCSYSLNEKNEVSFTFPSSYNKNLPLIIDPELIASTFSGTSVTVYGHTATYDNQGNIYGGGRAFGAGYPVTTGAIQTTFGGNVDMCVSKFSPDGTSLLFATYIGGNGQDLPHSLIVTDFLELVIFGSTNSDNFPTSDAAFDDTYNGATDMIITVIKETGNSLIGSTYMGGNADDGLNAYDVFYEDSYRGEVFFGTENGNTSFIYVASTTNSNNFPVTSGAYQSTLNGSADAVVFKMNSDVSNLEWSTYFGGSNIESAFSMRLDSESNVYITGGTSSSNLPITSSAAQGTFLGGSAGFSNPNTDGFIAKFTPDGTSLLSSTFVGTTSFDQAYFMDIDKADDVYVFGLSDGNFPTSSGVYSDANGQMFLGKIDKNLSTFYWTTRLGGNNGQFPEIAPTAFTADRCGNIYMGGYTLANNNFPVTPDAFQSNASSGSGDYYFMVLDEQLVNLSYATYFGGSGYEHVDGGTSRFDNRGVVYQAVCTNSNNFFTTPGAYDSNLSTGWDLFTFKFDFEKGIVDATPSVDSSLVVEYYEGCVPFTVFFYQQNDTTSTTEYYWDFGDGGTSQLKNPIHTFFNPDIYTVQLVVIDSTTCNITDTAYVEVDAGFSDIEALFDFTMGDVCDDGGLSIEFTNNTLGNPDQNQWNFGNIPISITDNNPVIQYSYSDPGTYEVSLVVIDSVPCFVTDTFKTTIIYPEPSEVVATFDTPLGGCVPHTINFNTASVGQNFIWNIDGNTINGNSGIYEFTEAGVYDIQLLIEDALTCNQIDSITKTVEVYEVPVSDFTVPQNEIDIFVDLDFTFTGSIDLGVDFNWDFGDGNTSTEQNPAHSFTEVGIKTVCLNVTTPNGCTAQYCEEITVGSGAFLEVPNAFTPNGDNINDILMLESRGVLDLKWQIFNRWGDVIFESNDPTIGWDGTFNGELQEMDVYVYTLEVELAGKGRSAKTGNITLIH